VFGTATIRANGSRSTGQVAFLVTYELLPTSESNSLSPPSTESIDSSLSLGIEACYCELESSLCLDDVHYVSSSVRVIQICIS